MAFYLLHNYMDFIFLKKTIQDLEIFFFNLSQNYHLMSIFFERKE